MQHKTSRKKNAEDAGLVPLPLLPGYHTSFEARRTRNLFTTYFRSLAGYILWQDKSARTKDMKD